MTLTKNTIEVTVERTIPASAEELFDGWLDPKIPGNPWNFAEDLSLNAKTGGLFYWRTKETAHYGRFSKVERAACIQHTWVSPNTLGEESVVTVTFREKGDQTVMTLVHSGLPDTERGRGHEKGWNFFLDRFSGQIGSTYAGR
jgi:uncharacterized protein YndB with AHSA1/START domain